MSGLSKIEHLNLLLSRVNTLQKEVKDLKHMVTQLTEIQSINYVNNYNFDDDDYEYDYVVEDQGVPLPNEYLLKYGDKLLLTIVALMEQDIVTKQDELDSILNSITITTEDKLTNGIAVLDTLI